MLKKKMIPLLLTVAISVTAFLIPVNVQAITVSQQYINQNRSYQSLQPQGLVIHDTDNAGATAQNNRDYFNRIYASASAHCFVDWNNVIQTIPENEVAWHAGYTANHRYLSIEMCEPANHNVAQFNTMYQKAVELSADICKRYGWSANNIVSHYWCSITFGETDHEDPIAFLKDYGKSWDILLSDIQKAINGESVSVTTNTIPSINSNNATDYSRYGSFVGGRCGELQTLLNKVGYNLVVDSKFGANTLNAVMSFQQKYGLQVDGYAGNQTFSKLNEVIGNKPTKVVTTNSDNWVARLQAECNRQRLSQQIVDNIAGRNTLNGCPTLRQGSQGNITKLLQEKLVSLGYDTNGIDGIFGSGTAYAVAQWQKANGLYTDGIIGRQSWSKLLGLQ